VISIHLPGGRKIDYADEKAALFFLVDPSSAGNGSYDGWASSRSNPPDSFVAQDLTAINTTMSMRSPKAAWSTFTTGGSQTWLQALDRKWDIIEMSDRAWVQKGCQATIGAAVMALNGKDRRAAGVTKMLHLKRPRLIPICDSLVMQMMGQNASDGPSTCRLIEAIRQTGRANRRQLQMISQELQTIGISRSLVRILDAVMWFDAPTAKKGPYQMFEDWLTTHHGGRLFF
jgi:hypothetical protein